MSRGGPAYTGSEKNVPGVQVMWGCVVTVVEF